MPRRWPMANSGRIRPVLWYLGSKWRIAPWVISHFPPHKTYVEPFGGSAAVLMQKPRSFREVYGEVNGEIVNLFQVLRDPGQAAELHRLLDLTPYARGEYQAAFDEAPDPVEKARRTLVQSFFGRGILSGKGSHGSFAVRDKGVRNWPLWVKHMGELTERLAGVIIENRPALRCLEIYDGPETLFYLDPPYVAASRRSGANYASEMSDDDHRELAGAVHRLQGMAIISGYASALYDELYQGWERYEKHNMDSASKPRTEVLWVSPRASRGRLF